MPFLTQKQIPRILLPLILALGAVLRLNKLALRDFWYDEAFTGIIVREPFGVMMRLAVQDVHPPLYYILLKPFSALFGYNVFGIRAFSVVFGLLTIWAVYLLGKELFGTKGALISAFITALAPFAIQFSQEGRMYAMYAFLVALAAYFFLRGVKQNSKKLFLVWGFLLGLASLTHYMGLLFVPMFLVCGLLWQRMSSGGVTISWRSMTAGVAVCGVVFLPWFPFAFRQFTKLGAGLAWILPAGWASLSRTLQVFLFGTPPGNLSQGNPGPNQLIEIQPFAALALVTVVIAVVGFCAYRIDRQKATFLLLLGLGPVVALLGFSAVGAHYLVARYILPSAFMLFLLLGFLLSRLRIQYALTLGAASVALLFFLAPYKVPHGWNSFQRELSSHTETTMYVLNSFDYVIAKYYVGKDRLILFNASQPESLPKNWAGIGNDFRSSKNPETLRGPNTLVFTYLSLDHADSRPPSLEQIEFSHVATFDNLFLFRAK